MTDRIHYSPEAEQHLQDLDDWVTKQASPATAQRLVTAIMTHIDGILMFPYAGRDRSDIRPGMKTTTYRKNTVVAYDINDTASPVKINIIGIYHGGQDWETTLRDPQAKHHPD